MEYETHAGVRENEDMLGSFRVVTTAGALGIVLLAPKRLIICPVAEWPETNLEYHIWNKGEEAFKAADKDEKLIKGKPAEGIYCFFSTM